MTTEGGHSLSLLTFNTPTPVHITTYYLQHGSLPLITLSSETRIMRYLPPEIWTKILADLSSQDILNLPFDVVSNNLLQPLAAKRFQQFKGTVTFASLHNLTRIAVHPILGLQLTQLTLCLQLLGAMPLVADQSLARVPPLQEMSSDLSIGQRYLLSRRLFREQQSLQRRQMTEKVLTAVFRSLKNLVRLSIECLCCDIEARKLDEADYPYEDLFDANGYERSFLTSIGLSPTSGMSTRHLIAAVFGALSAAETHLPGFKIDYNDGPWYFHELHRFQHCKLECSVDNVRLKDVCGG